jgi:N-acetylmuramoyl-L-alanine amidase
MEYLKAVLNNDTKKEKENLEILVKTGKKLHRNVSKYKKELKKYRFITIKKQNKIEPIKITKIEKIKKSTFDKNDYKYSIKSVKSEKNMIIIDFKTNITRNYIDFKENKEKGNYQDIFDLKGNFKDAYPTKLKIAGVHQIVITQKDSNTLRILLEDKRNIKTIYIINKKRVIIKVLDVSAKENSRKKASAKISKSPVVNLFRKNKIVVLDAGHGGKDSGAVGVKNHYEKIAVFKVVKYVENILKKRGYKVYITRNSDRFIKVRNRTVLANNKNADIFISIHANAAPKSKIKHAKGIETFFLSPARSARAKRVAALENKSDVVHMSGSTKQAFLESLNRPRITASHKLSIDLQRNMLYDTRKLYKDVVDGGVREGPFWVLVGAQMPSVLIEIGYITHPVEGRRLYTARYQKMLALGIANGIDSYFAKNP